MGEFFGQFFGFLFFAPLTAVAFGFFLWLVPTLLLRRAIGGRRPSFFQFFVAGYLFIALLALYLLTVGAKLSPAKGGGRHHEAAPLLGTVASLALVWGVRRLVRSRFPNLGRARRPAGPPAARHPYAPPGYAPPGYPPPPPGYGPPTYGPPGYGPAGHGQPPFGQPNYGQPNYGQPGPPAYPPWQPGFPGFPQPTPPPTDGPPPDGPQADGAAPPPRKPGVPWVVPPDQPGTPPGE